VAEGRARALPLAGALARLRARVEPRLAPLAASKGRWLPLLAGALVLLVLGAALLVSGPGKVTQSQEIDVLSATQDQGLSQLDGDRDGLSDLEELTAGTSPERNDTDADGMPDLWEVRHARLDALSNSYCPDPLVADAQRDCDRDGLANVEELAAGTDPADGDIDGDGLPDGMEVACGSDPFRADATLDPDQDGLTNLREMQAGTRCDRADSDLDGLTDPEELSLTRSDPTRQSTGGSGIADGWLSVHKLPLDQAAAGFDDPDTDALTNLEEYQASAARLRFHATQGGKELLDLMQRGLDPFDNDTDGDRMPDGYEVRFALDPLDDGKLDPRLGPQGDPDEDGLTNLQESAFLSSPFLTDSDGDGLSDKQEVDGYDATIAGKVQHVTSDPGRADTDGDGLTDLEEKQGKASRAGAEYSFPPLDPRNPDTDLDGLADLQEIANPCVSASEPRRLDPTNPDTDADGLLDGDEFAYWRDRHAGSGTDFEALLDRVAREMGQRTTGTVSRDAALSALQPCGDLDGDAKPNLLDRDSDGDTIDDGKETSPEDKPTEQGSRIRRPLSATDPALQDTDGEGLPDSWENQFASYKFDLGDWNLNASKRDSLKLNDGRTDADRDLDDDGVDYNGTGYAERVRYEHTNLFEYLGGTDPNDADSDHDGLSDGWETYFTCITASVPKKLCGPLGRSERAELEVELDPSDPDADHDGVPDANETGKAVPFLRFLQVEDSNQAQGELDANRSEGFAACVNDSSHTDCDIFGVQGGPAILRVHGVLNLSYGQEFDKDLDPSVADTDGDGLPDAWEAAYGLNPLEAGDGGGDLDNDQLTNLAEFRAGSDPAVKDTDLGGLDDGKDSDPTDPTGDAPLGDADCDGVLNKDEQPQGTSLADPDTDRDGLLDGPGIAFYDIARSSVVQASQVAGTTGCTLSLAQLQQRFVDLGVAQDVGPKGALFLGEQMACKDGACPEGDERDTDGDGIPDGWEAYWMLKHGVEGRDAVDPGFVADGDALNNSAEYRSGMPAGWERGDCPVWWLGTDPRSGDTDGDGLLDGSVTDDGQILGADFDLDNDGLDDFTGEDPAPLFDHANRQDSPLGDCTTTARFVETWVFRDQRSGTATLDANGDGVPDAQDYARTRIVDVTAELDPGRQLPNGTGSTLLKGAPFVVRGKVVVDESGADRDRGVPGAVVLLNLLGAGEQRSGKPEDVLGLAMTGPDGRFEVLGNVSRSRSAALPQGAVVFGEPRGAGAMLSWSPDTSDAVPDAGYRLSVFTISRAQGPDGPYGFTAAKPSGGTFAASGERGANVTSGPSSDAFRLPLLTLQSGSEVSIPGALNVTAGETLAASGSALDALGDPLPERFLQGGVLRARWLGALYTGEPQLEVRDGSFDLQLPVGEDTALGPHLLEVFYDGSNGLVTGSDFQTEVQVRYPTNITGSVANEGLEAVAGESLVVEGRVVDFQGRALPAGLGVEVVVAGTTFPGAVGEDGAFRVEGTVPDSVGVGTQAVLARFPGSASYEPSEGDAGFVTLIQKTRLALQGGTSPLGRDLVITGTLLDLAGNPVDDPAQEGNTTVRVTTPVLSGEANVTGAEFRLTVPRGLLPGAGPFPVRADFEGTRLYQESSDARDMQLSSRTAVSLLAGSLTRGRTSSLEGNLTDERGHGIAGERVNASFGNDTSQATTDADGNFHVPLTLPAGTPLGGVVARASYGGGKDGLLEPSPEASAVLQVVAATDLTLHGRTVALGPLPVQGNLTDDRGKPVPGAKLQVRLDGRTVGFTVTDLQGVFEGEVSLPADVQPGTHEVRVRFGGSGTLAAAEGIASYRLLSPSNLTLESVEPLVRDQPGLAIATLRAPSGAPLPNRAVHLRIGDTDAGQATTDAQGTARIQGRPAGFLAPGNVSVEVLFGGDDGYMPSSDAQRLPLTVRTDVQVELPDQVEKGQVFAGLIVVRDDQGRGLAGAEVVVTFTGFRYPVTLRTDAQGHANFTGRMQGPGLGAVTVRFPGAPGLAPAERTLQVQSRTPLLETGAGLAGLALLLAALAVLAAVVLGKRLRLVQVGEAEQIIREAERRLFASTEYQASILWAFRRLTEHMRQHGFLVQESFTPRELLDALARALPVARAPLEQLVQVFEEARYSPHPIGPRHRDQALQALRAIERDLREARLAQPPQPPAPGVTNG
jgi:protocatechuate 3,4-dioxygenase beta subunit